jgi:hypothetical protein
MLLEWVCLPSAKDPYTPAHMTRWKLGSEKTEEAAVRRDAMFNRTIMTDRVYDRKKLEYSALSNNRKRAAISGEKFSLM